MPSSNRQLFLVEGTIVCYTNDVSYDKDRKPTWRLVEAPNLEAAEDFFIQEVEAMSKEPRTRYRAFSVKAHETMHCPDVPVTK